MKEVEYYLENILKKQLLKVGITSNETILEDVRKQMISLLFHWKDRKIRDTVLLVGREEASFYEPKANLDTKSFVVMAIRNSLIETAGSIASLESGLEAQIKDMKAITFNAIQYFSKFDLEELSKTITEPTDDYYKVVLEKYPNSFQVLNLLANLEATELRFDKLEIIKCSNLSVDSTETTFDQKKRIIEDGYAIEPSINLKQALKAILEMEIPFFVDSFKTASRNFDKLCRVIQFLLENESAFVTSNYYISNGYISKRRKLLRPCHEPEDVWVKITDVTGISLKHKQYLKFQRQIHRKK